MGSLRMPSCARWFTNQKHRQIQVHKSEASPNPGRSCAGNETTQTISLSQGLPLPLIGDESLPSTQQLFTTIMLRNLPNQYDRDMLVDMLHTEGFAGNFRFVYLPIDFKTHVGLGYAFVDLSSPQMAESARQHFQGFCRWVLDSDKICSVSWSHAEQQGCDAHIERYRNSPIMHNSVPDTWKPALFSAGVRVPFPQPTKKLRVPRIRML